MRHAEDTTATGAAVAVTPAPSDRPQRIGDAYVLVDGENGGAEIRCAECSYSFGPATQDPKVSAVFAERSLSELSELNRFATTAELILREFYCPGCGGLIGANVQRPDDPLMIEMRLDS